MLCQCAICWMTGQIFPQNMESILYVISTIRANLHNLLIFVPPLPFSGAPWAAARSSKSTRGVVKLGQLLHRLVSKPRYVSHTWIQFCILMEVRAVSARRCVLSVLGTAQTNKRLSLLCTTLNNDPIRIICLNQPPSLLCCPCTGVKLWLLLLDECSSCQSIFCFAPDLRDPRSPVRKREAGIPRQGYFTVDP